MGKRGGKKKEADLSTGIHTSLTLREEASGKKQTHNVKSTLKLQHLQNLALWASGEASIPSLSAFFGRNFAACGEGLGIPPDLSLFSCQRCETILQPGFNCTVRIEKNQSRRRKRNRTITPTKNNVIYKCHFCSHRNLKRGTLKGHVQHICPPKPKLDPKPRNCTSADKCAMNKVEKAKADEINSPSMSKMATSADDFATGTKLLDSKRRKRKKPGQKRPNETEISSAPSEKEKMSGLSRKRGKSWTTLKEIAESEERDRIKRFSNFTIPLVL